jgi:ATP-dependent Clp protease ATP-binding subunit ClpA
VTQQGESASLTVRSSPWSERSRTCDPPGVFERFTERARQVVVLAQEEARSPALKHPYIGTEHILLGLLREEQGLAAQVLESLGITVERVREQVVRIVGAGEDLPTGQVPFTPRAKKVLELALREAQSLGHNYIATEHILLGLIRESDGVAARILLDFNTRPGTVRQAVIAQLPGTGARRRPVEPVQSGPQVGYGLSTAGPAIDPGWLDGLPALLAPLAAEIRAELGRAPDLGDLLICLACVPHTPAVQALGGLGVDVDQLGALIEGARGQAQADEDALAEEVLEVTRAKEQAIEQGRFQDAAKLRDQERLLRRDQQRGLPQVRAHPRAQLPTVDELRRRLGLRTPPQP